MLNSISYFYFMNLEIFRRESISDEATSMKTLLSWTWNKFAVESEQNFFQLLFSSTNRFSKQRITYILSKNKLLFNLPSRITSERKWKNLLSFFFMFPPLRTLKVVTSKVPVKFHFDSCEFRCWSGTCSKRHFDVKALDVFVIEHPFQT